MLKHSHYMIARGRIIIFLGVAIALIHWFGEGLVHFYVFERGDLADALLPSNIYELWTRSIVVCIIVGFSIFTQMVVNTLYETSKQYQSLFEEAPDAIFLADSESGIITDANPAASKLLLRPRHEIVGLHQSQIHPPVKKDDSTRIFTAQIEESRKRSDPQPTEYVVLRSDGTEVPVEIMAKTVKLGSSIMLQGIFRDVSERIRAADLLRESEQRFRSIFNNLVDGILLVDVESKKFYMGNKIICEMLGYDQEQLRNFGVADIHPEQDLPYAMEQFEKVARRELKVAEELPVKRKDGSVFYADINTFPIELSGKKYLTGIFRDVSERKKADEKLKQSEEKFRLAMEVTNDALWDWNIVTGEVYRNPRHATMLGYKPHEFPGSQEDWFKLIHPDDKPLIVSLIDEHLNGKREFFEAEYRLRTKSEDYLWILGRGKTVAHDDDGLPVRMVGTNIDITDRKRIEEAVRMSEVKYRAFFENDLAGSFISNPDGDLIDCNQAFLDLFGFTSMEEAQSIPLDSVYQTPTDREVMLDKIRKERKIIHYVHEVRKITGEAIIVDQNTVGEFNDDNNLVLIRGHIIDITDRKKAEEALQKSEERYRSVVEDTPVLMCNFLPDGEITFVNTAYCKYFNKTYEELVGKNFKSLIPEEDRENILKRIRTLTIDSDFLTHEHKVTASDDQIHWHRWTNRALFDEQGSAVSFQSFGEDITEQKQAEEKLEMYRVEMAHTEQLASLGTLSATVAHELTQPLTVIHLSIENALDELEGTICPETVNDKLRRSIAELSNITTIIDRFRSFARRSADPSISEVDLQAVGVRIVNLLSRAARQTRTTLHLEGMAELPHIEGNEKDLEQLFFALIYNAILAGDATPNCKVVVSGVVKDDHIELRFSDTSGGIPPENLDRIFEPFFTTRPAGQGTGLGLSVVQDIVSRARGKISVESKFGEGSTFLVRLPVRVT